MKLTLTQFVQLDNPEFTTLETIDYLIDLLKSDYHYGDCTHQNISCKFCELVEIINKYENYCSMYKLEHGKPMICYMSNK